MTACAGPSNRTHSSEERKFYEIIDQTVIPENSLENSPVHYKKMNSKLPYSPEYNTTNAKRRQKSPDIGVTQASRKRMETFAKILGP